MLLKQECDVATAGDLDSALGEIDKQAPDLVLLDLLMPGRNGMEMLPELDERGLKIPDLFQPLRCALTGLPGGPDLFELMSILGADRVRNRIQSAVTRLA